MEEKQLNFDKPLLSVRRFTSGAALVNEGKSKTEKSIPIEPQPPRYKSELKSGPVRNAGTVPFVWEQQPGKPKDEKKLQNHAIERNPTAPKLPPGRDLRDNQQEMDNASVRSHAQRNGVENLSHGSQILPHSVEATAKCESPKVSTKDNSSLDDGDETYIDAVDTLSRTESFYINCSMSGLSGLDVAEMGTSGLSGMDPQTRDLMMGRFLPAAKAMASEMPRDAPKKPPVVPEQPRRPQNFINGDKRPQLRYGADFAADCSHYDNNFMDDESDDDYEDEEIFSTKVCGLLPRLGFKSSFCLLSPFPGISASTRAPVSPLSKAQTGSSSSGSCSELDYEPYRYDTSGQTSVGGLQTTKRQVNRTNRKNDSSQIGLQDNYMRRKECLDTYKILPKHKTAINFTRKTNNSEPTRSDLIGSEEFPKGTLEVEKTLYVDSVHKLDNLNIEFSLSNTNRRTAITEKEHGEHGVLTEMIERSPIKKSSHGMDKLIIENEGAESQNDIQKPVAFDVIPSGDEENQEEKTFALKTLFHKEDLNGEAILSSSLQVPQQECTKKLENQSEAPAPPLSLKSPTDSWLGRTLASIPVKNASLRPFLGTGLSPKHRASNPKSSDLKWETIVKGTKTTNVQHRHLRFSQETLTTIPEA